MWSCALGLCYCGPWGLGRLSSGSSCSSFEYEVWRDVCVKTVTKNCMIILFNFSSSQWNPDNLQHKSTRLNVKDISWHSEKINSLLLLLVPRILVKSLFCDLQCFSCEGQSGAWCLCWAVRWSPDIVKGPYIFSFYQFILSFVVCRFGISLNVNTDSVILCSIFFCVCVCIVPLFSF